MKTQIIVDLGTAIEIRDTYLPSANLALRPPVQRFVAAIQAAERACAAFDAAMNGTLTVGIDEEEGS